MGDGNHGRLGHGETTALSTPAPIRALSNSRVNFVACGAYHSGISSLFMLTVLVNKTSCRISCLRNASWIIVQCAVAMDETGTVFAWGKNESGQLGLGHNKDSSLPLQVEALRRKNIKMVSSESVE
jgi:alpha-tubulin suppressor-like RCC1 family protein